uniref:Putative proline-rich receptor-like protein kinase PERK10 isoform X1 n=1 Tax=Davidia involucrata TaxID=16924 RepID=A0A5B7BUF4_DAVIN
MMGSSQFMDKQKMEFSRSPTKGFFDFSNLHDESEEEYDDDDHSYGFHPIRPIGTSQSDPDAFRNCSSTDRIDSVKVTREKIGMALISEIDRMMKDHVNNLLHAVDGISARLSQLETKTRQLENAVDDLKDSTEYNHGRTDGKLRQLENMLREVQDGIHFLRDKQEIAETQLQLDKIQGSKGSPQSEDQKSAVQTESMQQTSSSASQQSHRPLPIPGALSIAHATLSPSIPSTLPYQNPPPGGVPVAAQLPTQIPYNLIPSAPQAESYHVPSGGQTLETTHQQYHVPPPQQAQPPPPAADHLYQPAPQFPQVSQSTQLSQLHPPVGAVNPQNHLPLSHHPAGTPYMPSPSCPPSILQSFSQPPGVAPTQQFYVGSTQQMHDQHLSRPNSNFPTGYSHTPGPANFSKMHPYGGSPLHYSNSTMIPSQLSPSSSVSSGGNNYSRLPKAQILPHALPMAASIDGGSGSVESGKKVPNDDVVDKVTAMGFRRDLVRATVRKLTENGQSVDLNVVLDKLMSNGNMQPQKG